MKMFLDCATTQQIGALAPQLPRAGACQRELLTGLALDQQVYRIQKLRQLLDLVDDDILSLRVGGNWAMRLSG
jgi:hypothetical protein